MTRKKRFAILTMLAVLAPMTMTLRANAQAIQQAPSLELGAGFVAEHTQYTSGTSLWMKGGFAEAAFEGNHHLGVFAKVAGDYSAGKPGSSAAGVITVTVGPRLRFDRGRSRIFLEGSVGAAHGFAGTFPSSAGASSSWYSFASQAGGGYQVTLSRRLAFRPLDLEYVRTTFPNSTNNVQNNFRMGAGIFLRFSAD